MGYIVEVDILNTGNWIKSCKLGLKNVVFDNLNDAEEAMEQYRSRSGGMNYRVTDLAQKYAVEAFFHGPKRWEPSGNEGLCGRIFDTLEAAQAAIKEFGSANVEYRAVSAYGKPEISEVIHDLSLYGKPKISEVIHDLSLGHQFLTADMVQERLVELGFNRTVDIGNRAGSFFKNNPDARKVPNFTVRSKRAERKGSQIGVYRSVNYVGPKVTRGVFAKGYNAKGAAAGK